MSTFSQNPDPVTDFDQITCGIPATSAWEAMFSEAEETLAESRLGGFEVEEIGRTAFDSLPDSEKDAALDVLFYTYWAARQDDLAARARSWNLHSQDCPKYTPGHELASPTAELERLRTFAAATTRRHQEIRDHLAQVDIRNSAEAWDLGMAVLAILEGPLSLGIDPKAGE